MNNKLAIGILTYNRVRLLEETLISLLKYNEMYETTLLIVDNGSTAECQKSNRIIAERYNAQYVYIKTFYDPCNINKNIEVGHYRVICELLNIKSEVYCILEDDWGCMGKIPYIQIAHFLNQHEEIGQVRIRDFRYDDSFYGGSSRNFVTMKQIKFDNRFVVDKVIFDVAEMHWVNACNVMRRDSLEYMMRYVDSEIEKMILFHKKYPINAQMKPGIFRHIGPQRVRDDLRKRGLF